MRATKFGSVFFIFLFLFLSGCATSVRTGRALTPIYKSAPERPEWITKRPESKDYFYAVGMEDFSSSLQKAKESAVQIAVSEVANYLGMRVSSRFEQKKTELAARALTDLTTSASSEITTASQAKIKGSRMTEMYYEQYRDVINGEVVTSYDVYVLLRIPYIEIQREKERQKKELEQALVQIRKIFDEGGKSLREGDLTLAFRRWFIALEIVEEIDPGLPIKYEIISKVKGVINRMTISFDDRKEEAVEKFPVRLSLRVQFDEKKNIPLKNIPLQFSFLRSRGVLDEAAATDSEGKAYCNIYSVAAWPQKAMIESRLAPENILPKSTKLSPEFTNEIKGLMNAKKAVYIFSAGPLPDVKSLPLAAFRSEEPPHKMGPDKEILLFDIKPGNKYVLSSEETKLFLFLKMDMQGIEVMNLSRPPLNIGLVIDRSGSMEEEKKMEYTKEAAMFLIDNLDSNDFLSIVAYDRDIEIINPAAPVTEKNLLKHKVEGILAGGTTNLSGGFLEGYQQVLKNLKESFVNRIILLSDGLANVGITREKTLFSLVKNYRKQGVSITTLGVGADFNEDLMLGLAEYSSGNYYFVENPEKIPEIFQRELKQLLAVIAQNITVELYPEPGVEIATVLNSKYNPEKISERGMRFSLGDISSGERKIIIVELKLPKLEKGEKNVAKVKIKYDDIAGGGGRVKKEKDISVIYTNNSQLVKTGEDQEVANYVRASCAADMMQKAMKTLDAGLYDETAAILKKEYDSIIEYVEVNPDPWLVEKAEIFKHCANKLVKMKNAGKLHGRHSLLKGLRKELHYQEHQMMIRHHK